jgi:hypothetical protein
LKTLSARRSGWKAFMTVEIDEFELANLTKQNQRQQSQRQGH